jgi:hypothetical protein
MTHSGHLEEERDCGLDFAALHGIETASWAERQEIAVLIG